MLSFSLHSQQLTLVLSRDMASWSTLESAPDLKLKIQRPSSRSCREPLHLTVAPVVNHVAPAAAVVGHSATYAAPLAVSAPIAAAPVAYGDVLGYGAALGVAAPLGLGYGSALGLCYGLGYGKALIH
ncbi:hypothetical protein HNY73_009185 [Argiope bruennichi]|uniref:Uncharacterized protein n=2 Tax=Argiope bruennichi TaxID=94029 RepID=A0A8T0FBF7_ARGBR|nr:hypothetical protein HNY73_009185 [Argiope bruennichi]